MEEVKCALCSEVAEVGLGKVPKLDGSWLADGPGAKEELGSSVQVGVNATKRVPATQTVRETRSGIF